MHCNERWRWRCELIRGKPQNKTRVRQFLSNQSSTHTHVKPSWLFISRSFSHTSRVDTTTASAKEGRWTLRSWIRKATLVAWTLAETCSRTVRRGISRLFCFFDVVRWTFVVFNVICRQNNHYRTCCYGVSIDAFDLVTYELCTNFAQHKIKQKCSVEFVSYCEYNFFQSPWIFTTAPSDPTAVCARMENRHEK